MEIPAWAETLFEKVVVVFETPASDTLEAAGSMDLLPWIDSLLVEIPLLIENVKANVFPASFLTNVLGIDPQSLARLPLMLTLFVVFYLLCGGATVALRLRTGQTSLLSFSRQCFNAVLIWASFLLIPMRKLLAQAPGDSSVYPLLALGAVILSVAIPLTSVVRYLWIYRLTGIPHAVFDVGFGLFVLSVALLAAKSTSILWLLVPVSMAALTVVQWEGHRYEEDDHSGQPSPEPKAPRKVAPEADIQTSPEVDIDAILAEKDSLPQP